MAHADQVSRAALATLAEEIGELLDGAELGEGVAPASPAAKGRRRAGARAAGKRAALSADAAGGARESESAELVETFAVWTLDARALLERAGGGRAAQKSGAKKSGGVKSAAKPGALKAHARPTGRWHHQIKVGGRAAAFARSSGPKLKLDSASLRGLFVAPLARKIEAAVVWIDENEPDERDGVRDPVVRLLVVPSHQLHAFWLLDEREGTSEVLVVDAPARFDSAGRGRRLLGESEFFELLRRSRPVRGLD